MSRLSLPALLVGILPLLAAVALTLAEAIAHHPGSHAARMPDGRVRLQIATVVPDACTTLGAVRRGAPAGLAAAADADAVTVALDRPAGAVCAQVVQAARAEAVIESPASLAMLHLFFRATDGRIASTERVPIR